MSMLLCTLIRGQMSNTFFQLGGGGQMSSPVYHLGGGGRCPQIPFFIGGRCPRGQMSYTHGRQMISFPQNDKFLAFYQDHSKSQKAYKCEIK